MTTVNNTDMVREQMRKAVAIAAEKVEKGPKAETGHEMSVRIHEEKETKKNKSIKRAAKSMIKKKKMRGLSAYFAKK